MARGDTHTKNIGGKSRGGGSASIPCVPWDDWRRIAREISGLQPQDRVLVVSCGRGELAFELAPECAYVAGVDFSESMIAEAMERVIESGVDNLSFQVGGDGTLEFDERSFDRVFCIMGLHRFQDAGHALAEMVRVLRVPGHLVLADMVSSDNPVRRQAHDRIERSWDPSHKALLSPREVRAMLEQMDLSIEQEQVWRTKTRFSDWMRRVNADRSTVERTRRLVLEAAEKKTTNLEIERGKNGIEITHRWMAWVALKLV